MKYVGSKNRLSKELSPIIQNYITEDTVGYLEPFVGGANMIDKIKHYNKIGCDIHKELIALLIKVRDCADDLPYTITKKQYYQVKDNKLNYKDWFVGLVGFCASYNSRYFEGYANNIKTKNGTVRNYTDESIRNLKKQSSQLKNIKFINCDFRYIKNLKNYVIYCDIPYRNTTKYATNKFPYDDFYKWVKKMSENNIVLISEYDMPKEFKCIWSKDRITTMNYNRKKEKEKKTEKLFLVNKYI